MGLARKGLAVALLAGLSLLSGGASAWEQDKTYNIT
ncbi:hypothetical protein, partial [Cronobacter sakazakii]